MRASRSVVFVAVGVLVAAACGSDEGSTAALMSPVAGARVAGGVELEMAAEGITIEEAGVARDGAGHFHVVADVGCAKTGDVIGKDADHVHFGAGQTTGLIYLGPGSHDLCLQVGDGAHQALGITDRHTIEVGIADQAEFCDVVIEVDELFDAVDNSSDDFSVKQVGYENIRRLAAQLTAALDFVDPGSRDDLAATVSFVDAMTSALVEAADLDEAERALEPIFETVGAELPGAGWILDNCGIDIAGEDE
ncbi:MAG: DUF4399 domain-containing protein [Acidimicrobiia bacterium]|nr:DUF4399 domain-containing protein [Acidimicrobiia bacterium]